MLKKDELFHGVVLQLTVFAVLLFSCLGVSAELKSPLSNPELLSRSLYAVKSSYIDKDRVNPEEMLKAALDEIQKTVPEILAEFDDKSVLITVDVASKRFSTRGVNSLNNLDKKLQEILGFIDLHYNGDIEKKKIEYAAINGVLGTLDPHSSFLSPEIFQEFKVGTKGEFGGLGIVISIKDGELTVIAPIDGTPASKAGIKSQDKIIQIGDESTINMSLVDAVNRLRGPIGTDVSIVIERKGLTEPMSITLKRALINIDSIQQDVVKKNEKRFGYLKVKNFQSNTVSDAEKALKELSKEKMDGLILDLRNNPGGLLNQSVELTDLFVSKGKIVSTIGSNGELLDVEEAKAQGEDVNCPLVVLINEGSASAAEIVAGALKELQRAVVIGHSSFGKGSVQAVYDVSKDAAIKLTIAKYHPAGTYSIQSIGLTPDVALIPVEIGKERVDLIENKSFSEKDLEKYIVEEKGREEKPTYKIRYLAPEKKDEDEELKKSEYVSKPDLKEDFAVNFASDILDSVNTNNRKEMLSEIAPLVKNVEADEEKKIVDQLALIMIDWSEEAVSGKAGLKVTFDILKKGKKIEEIPAGDEVDLELKATNVGNGVFARLIGVTESDMLNFADKEFVFGKLKPGETRTWKVPIKIPDFFPDADLPIKIVFNDGKLNEDNSVEAILPVKGINLPRFGFSYNLTSKQVGADKEYSMSLTVKNIGEGKTSKETVALLSNESGEKLFIEKGRANIGELVKDKSKNATFVFKLLSGFADTNIILELDIVDSKRLVGLHQKITVDLKSGSVTPEVSKFYEPPVIELESYPKTIKAKEIEIKGVARDNEVLKDCFVFVGDKKVTYLPNASGSKSLAFDVKVPLENGNNIILISARDDTGLTGRKMISVNSTVGETKKDKTKSMIPTIPGVSY